MKKTIRIITPDSPGLLNDAKTYELIFIKNNFLVIVHKINNNTDTNNNNNTNNIVLDYCDVNLFLEHLPINKLLYPCKINMFMPNHELFFHFDKLPYVHYILCKTKIALEMFKYIKKENNYKYICLYTKFTTFIPKELRMPKHINNKDPNLFVHMAGKSRFKNTASLMYCWIKNDGFLNIDPDIKLVITCYNSCFKYTMNELKNWFKLPIHLNKDSHRNDILIYKNIKLYVDKAPSNEYTNLLINANVAICTSEREGFGHYINESRYYKTPVITINYAPMNELIENNVNGFLIMKFKTAQTKQSQYMSIKTYKVYPNVDELTEKIIYCIKNKNSLVELGINSRKKFFKDKKFFNNKIKKIINNNILPKFN